MPSAVCLEWASGAAGQPGEGQLGMALEDPGLLVGGCTTRSTSADPGQQVEGLLGQALAAHPAGDGQGIGVVRAPRAWPATGVAKIESPAAPAAVGPPVGRPGRRPSGSPIGMSTARRGPGPPWCHPAQRPRRRWAPPDGDARPPLGPVERQRGQDPPAPTPVQPAHPVPGVTHRPADGGSVHADDLPGLAPASGPAGGEQERSHAHETILVLVGGVVRQARRAGGASSGCSSPSPWPRAPPSSSSRPASPAT